MPYIKTNDGSVTVFTVRRDKPPPAVSSKAVGVVLLVCTGLFIGTIALCAGSTAGAVLIGLPLIAAGIWIGIKVKTPDPATQLSIIQVTSSQISKDGRTIAVKDIHRLIIHNPMSESMEGRSTVLVGNANYLAGQRMGMARNKALEKTAYRLDLEAGGNAITLADSLAETVVFGLAKDIQAITGVEFHH